MRYHLTTVRMTTIKKTSTGEDVEKREPSCTADGNGKLVQPLWKTLWRFLKTLTIELPYDLANPLLVYIWRKWNHYLKRYLYYHVHCGVIHNSKHTVVAQSCPTLCNTMDCSRPSFPDLSCLPVCSNSCPSSRWCHPTSSFSVVPFSYPQSFLASGSFPMSWLIASGSQSTGASASVFQWIWKQLKSPLANEWKRM